jgi:hypothetical protein
MRKQYLYVISYWHSNGQGCAQITRSTKIKTIEDFNGVLKHIEAYNGLKNVIICNIMLLGKVKV